MIIFSIEKGALFVHKPGQGMLQLDRFWLSYPEYLGLNTARGSLAQHFKKGPPWTKKKELGNESHKKNSDLHVRGRLLGHKFKVFGLYVYVLM